MIENCDLCGGTHIMIRPSIRRYVLLSNGEERETVRGGVDACLKCTQIAEVLYGEMGED